jgi:hypothetical protein
VRFTPIGHEEKRLDERNAIDFVVEVIKYLPKSANTNVDGISTAYTLALWKKDFLANWRFVNPACLKHSVSTNAVPANIIAWNNSRLIGPDAPGPFSIVSVRS